MAEIKPMKIAVWLISLLKRSELTLNEIKREFRNSNLYEGKDLQDRTFRNYMDTVREEFGINIKCTRITTGLHVYHIDTDKDDMDEIKQFAIDYFTICNTLRNRMSTSKIRDRILFQRCDTGSKYLVDIINAMVNSLMVEIHYVKFDGSESDRVLAPFFLRVFENRWYLVAKEVLKDGEEQSTGNKTALKTFSLDKVVSLKVTSDKFLYDFKGDPERYFDNSFGIYVYPDEPVEITLKFTGKAMRFVRNRPLHRTQTEVYSDGEKYIAKVKVNPSEDFVMRIMSYGPEAEVLSPAYFRDELADKVAQMCMRYFDSEGEKIVYKPDEGEK